MKLRTHSFQNFLYFLPDEEQSQGNWIIPSKLKEQWDFTKFLAVFHYLIICLWLLCVSDKFLGFLWPNDKVKQVFSIFQPHQVIIPGIFLPVFLNWIFRIFEYKQKHIFDFTNTAGGQQRQNNIMALILSSNLFILRSENILKSYFSLEITTA